MFYHPESGTCRLVRVQHYGALVLDAGQLAFRRLAEAAETRLGLVGQARHLEEYMRLGDERADPGQANRRPEAVKGDQRRLRAVDPEGSAFDYASRQRILGETSPCRRRPQANLKGGA
jgi:hypothetical protein